MLSVIYRAYIGLLNVSLCIIIREVTAYDRTARRSFLICRCRLKVEPGDLFRSADSGSAQVRFVKASGSSNFETENEGRELARI